MNDVSLVEKSLFSYIPKNDEYIKKLFDSMRYSVEAGGKRIRPRLVLEFCRLCGGDIEKARKIFREAKKEWSDNVEIMLLFISHGRIDRIDEAFDSAETYLKNDDIIMFLAECSTARLLTEHFIDVEYPYINNIF